MVTRYYICSMSGSKIKEKKDIPGSKIKENKNKDKLKCS